MSNNCAGKGEKGYVRAAEFYERSLIYVFISDVSVGRLLRDCKLV